MSILRCRLNHTTADEATQWLREHISAEDVRWWRVPVSGMWDGQGNFNKNFMLYVDVTEEEEPMLTAFFLKYS